MVVIVTKEGNGENRNKSCIQTAGPVVAPGPAVYI